MAAVAVVAAPALRFLEFVVVVATVAVVDDPALGCLEFGVVVAAVADLYPETLPSGPGMTKLSNVR